MYLKLPQYRQNSPKAKKPNKLAAKFYGPFFCVERTRKLVYRHQIPTHSQLPNVFHVSQLRASLVADLPVQANLPPIVWRTSFLVNLEDKVSLQNLGGRGGGDLCLYSFWKIQSIQPSFSNFFFRILRKRLHTPRTPNSSSSSSPPGRGSCEAVLPIKQGKGSPHHPNLRRSYHLMWDIILHASLDLFEDKYYSKIFTRSCFFYPLF